MKARVLLAAALVSAVASAGAITGSMPSPLLVSGSGRVYLLRPDGTVAWERKGCGNIHRAYAVGPHVYWVNGNLFRTEISTGRTELFYSPAPKEGAFGFTVRPNGNLVVAENATGYVTELAARFHRFYTVCRIKDAEPGLLEARLMLCDCVRRVIAISLGIIGVHAPEKM